MFDISGTFEKELKQVKKPGPKPVLLWTAEDDAREKALYLANPKAIWLNPNRYGDDGDYDLLADPYVEPVIALAPPAKTIDRKLGNWVYQNQKTKEYKKSYYNENTTQSYNEKLYDDLERYNKRPTPPKLQKIKM